MKLNCNGLNELFNIEGPEFIEVDDGERTNASGKHIGWGTEHRHTEESKKLIGSYHKGKVISEETRRKISEVSKGVPAPNRGGYGANNVRSVRWKLYHKCGKITDIVGIARSLAVEPDIWFLDEPFSALDPLIRKEMQDHHD